MIDRLSQKAPKAVMIAGVRYELITSFRNCLLSAYALEDDDLTDWEKREIIIENMYGIPFFDIPQEFADEAVEKAIKFLMCGDTNRSESQKKLCDLRLDGQFIYNALLKDGVDLDKSDDLHWWTFMGHFAEIGESRFARIVYLRQQYQRGKLTKEERQECEIIGWDIIKMVPEGERKKKANDNAEIEAAFAEWANC